MNVPFHFHAQDHDIAILAAIEDGLPLCEKPYARIGTQLKISEKEIINRLSQMQNAGIIRRFGLVLQHRALGFHANAMVVWNVPDSEVDGAAKKIISHDFVTLCYCRERHKQLWQYNLYCMIHGRERTVVEAQIETLKKSAELEKYPTKTLFSRRRFKQTGARFSAAAMSKRGSK
jgi:DNA-binding Lrp family transcriptional regulator